MRFFGALLLAASAFATAPAFTLPDNAIPKKYTVELMIDPALPTFRGNIRIDVDLKQSASEIWLNAKDLTVLEATVNQKKVEFELSGGEFLGLRSGSRIRAGRISISIRYEGKLDENSVVGPYRKKVGDDWYVFTTFTPIDARRAFPCFDEPRFKARWEFTIHAPGLDKAFTNGRKLRETPDSTGKAIRFAETEPLPTEVVAFAVGPFDVFKGANAGHNTAIEVVTPRGLAEQGRAAAQATVDVLPRLEAYTGIPYPFGKLDHVALPEGAFGAVENPGLITYRQRGLLAPPGEETPEKIRAIRSVESHEIAHQWFGDMVTQANWNDVWLSEGFATWLSAKIMDQFQTPERQHLAAVAARERIMTMDDSPRTRPVRVTMHTREEMRNVYNQVVYQKGAAILLMVEDWLGEAKMQSGLRDYLKRHAFANATTGDLESSLERASGVDPTLEIDSFLNQTGIPVMHGEVRCDGSPRLVLSQTNTAHSWSIPVCYRSDAGSACTVLNQPHAEVALKSCATWIYLNAGATGYYRTAWTADQVPMLEHALPQLSAAERLMLVYDLGAAKLAPARLLSTLASDAQPEVAKAASEVK